MFQYRERKVKIVTYTSRHLPVYMVQKMFHCPRFDGFSSPPALSSPTSSCNILAKHATP